MKIRRITFVLVLALSLFLAGCAGSQAANNSDYYEPEGNYGESYAANDNAAGESGFDSSGHDEASTAPQERIVIMHGEMTVATYDPAEIVGFITDLTARYQGYVIESTLENVTLEEDTPAVAGYIRVRIPAERLNDAIAEIEAQQLEVDYKAVSGEDVTADYVDLQSRLRNLEDAAAQLEAIMDNATDTEAVLEVYKELTEVNEEAEVVRGQIQYYDESAAMSSLSVRVNQIIDEPEPTPTPTPSPWSLGPTFERSGERLTRSFQYWLEDVVSFFVYGLPMFILRVGPWLVAFFFIGRWIFRAIRGRKNKGKEPVAEPEKDSVPDA
jgi:hypothetical protein